MKIYYLLFKWTKDGDVIYYSANNAQIRYELTYNYFRGKLISIKQKDFKNHKNNRIYSLFALFYAKFEALFFFDKLYYYDYKKEENVLLELYNNMLIY